MTTLTKAQQHIVAHKQYYADLAKEISFNTSGRICHHRTRILHAICKTLPIKTYLEIGVHSGASMSYVIHNTHKIDCYGIDLFDDTFGHYKVSDHITLQRTTQNINKNNNSHSTVQLIKGNSFKEETIKKLSNHLKTAKIDLLFIDGDHSFNGVAADFKNYTPFVKSHGIIVIDDYAPKHPGTVKYVNEHIKKNKAFTILGVYGGNELVLIKH